jgi:hypothetical protein
VALTAHVVVKKAKNALVMENASVDVALNANVAAKREKNAHANVNVAAKKNKFYNI